MGKPIQSDHHNTEAQNARMTKQEIFTRLVHFSAILAGVAPGTRGSWVHADAVRALAAPAWRRYLASGHNDQGAQFDFHALSAASNALNSSSRFPWTAAKKAHLDRALSLVALAATAPAADPRSRA